LALRSPLRVHPRLASADTSALAMAPVTEVFSFRALLRSVFDNILLNWYGESMSVRVTHEDAIDKSSYTTEQWNEFGRADETKEFRQLRLKHNLHVEAVMKKLGFEAHWNGKPG
jgi:hypothetical protein